MQINSEQKTSRDYVRFKIAGSFRPPKILSNQELLSRTKFLVQKEREVHVQVLRHLREIESRKLYFSQGFSSLFDYAVRELGCSEGAAFRRIKAMRLCRDLPEAEEKLQSGKLSLSSASQLQNFFERQKKAQLKREKALESVNCIESEKPSKRVLPQISRREEPEESVQRFLAKNPKRIESEKSLQSEESRSLESGGGSQESRRREEPACLSCSRSQAGASSSFAFGETGKEKSLEEKEKTLNRFQKLDLIEKAEGRSSRETEKLLLERAPETFEKSAARREQARLLGNGRVEIKAIVSESCHKKLKELKNLLSHRNPSMEYGGLLEILSDLVLDKFDPCRKEERKKQTKGGQASGSVRSREKEGDKRPDGRNENCAASPAPASRSPGASISKPESRFFVASAQKSQSTEQIFTTSAPKLKSSPRMPVDSAASLPRLQHSAQTPDDSMLKKSQAAPDPATSAPKSQSTLQAAVDWAAPITKSQQTQQAFALTGNKGQQTELTGDTSPAPGASDSKSINRICTASAPKSQLTKQTFTTSAQKLRQATRYIPAEVKRRVWIRDKGCCSYMNPQTGQKCGSRRFLHIDHILPFALGGGSGADNLRLLCAGHNQFCARQTFKNSASENNNLS